VAKKFLTPIDLVRNELQNARIQNLASAPSSPVVGQVYYDTVLGGEYIWNGSVWLNGTTTFGAPTASTTFGTAAVTGTSAAVPHSDHTHGTPTHVGTDHTAVSLSSLAVPTAAIPFGGFKITSLADPTLAQDAATKNYVDATAQGLSVLSSAEFATTANLTATYVAGSAGSDGGLGVGATLTNSGTLAALVIDGHTAVVGDRLLVKNQATATQNGVYTVTAIGSGAVAWVLTRATDYDNHIAGQVVSGTFIFSATGTVNTGTGWVENAVGTAATPVNGIKIGTDNITFVQFSGAGTYSASNGVLLTGSNFTFAPLAAGGLQTASGGASVLLATNSGLSTASGLAVGAGTGITVTTGTVAVDATVVVKKFSQAIGDGSSTSIVVTHSLGTQDVHVAVYSATSTFDEVNCDIQHTSTSTITLLFSVAPTSGQYRVVVHA
jgi:hypothetical protein